MIIFLWQSRIYPSARFPQRDIGQYGEPTFHADVSQGIKEFQLFQLRRRSQQRRVGGFAA
jgi:hypothetical protein